MTPYTDLYDSQLLLMAVYLKIPVPTGGYMYSKRVLQYQKYSKLNITWLRIAC